MIVLYDLWLTFTCLCPSVFSHIYAYKKSPQAHRDTTNIHIQRKPLTHATNILSESLMPLQQPLHPSPPPSPKTITTTTKTISLSKKQHPSSPSPRPFYPTKKKEKKNVGEVVSQWQAPLLSLPTPTVEGDNASSLAGGTPGLISVMARRRQAGSRHCGRASRGSRLLLFRLRLSRIPLWLLIPFGHFSKSSLCNDGMSIAGLTGGLRYRRLRSF